MNENAQSRDVLESRIDQMMVLIDKAIGDVEADKPVEIGNMDERVEKLCKDILSTNPMEAKAMQPRLGEMISRLDELADVMQKNINQKS